jgi:hypothetical protein
MPSARDWKGSSSANRLLRSPRLIRPTRPAVSLLILPLRRFAPYECSFGFQRSDLQCYINSVGDGLAAVLALITKLSSYIF